LLHSPAEFQLQQKLTGLRRHGRRAAGGEPGPEAAMSRPFRSPPRLAVMVVVVVVACLASLLAPTSASAAAAAAVAAQQPAYTREQDVVYGRKFGVALTMDVFTPQQNANGAAAVFVVSGGWFSDHGLIDQVIPAFLEELLNRGYTVFAVCHGSQPKFTIPEILGDMHRSVRFIRHNAGQYKIDPDRIGIYGGSAGGHLSLMQGLAGDAGNPGAKDPVDQASSRVQAVGCFYPPTDFLNYGKPGEVALGNGVLKDFKAPFDFADIDPKTRSFTPVTDQQKRLEIGKQISPVTHVSADDPPTLIIHGDADLLVPIQQAQSLVEKLKAAGVEAKLVTKPGAAHGWAGQEKDVALIADWFDAHLKGGEAKGNDAAKPEPDGAEAQPGGGGKN
jgi:acetyl esterase/lipase